MLHHRRSIRLKGYDYSQTGAYFITICCYERHYRFGKIDDGAMILNKYGETAYNEWKKLPERFPNAALDVFQIMPNHMHSIIIINDPPTVRAGLAAAPSNALHIDRGQQQGIAPTIKTNATLGDIIGAYKSLVAYKCLNMYKAKNETMGKLWQRNYYEHIIRNEIAYQNISAYIINNPQKWQQDKFCNK